MRFAVTVDSAILSLTWVSCLRNVNKLSSSWFQEFHNCSKSFDFLDVSWSLFGYSLELIIGKIICRVKSFFIEILQSLIIGLFCFSFQLLVRHLFTTLLRLKLVLFITSHGLLIWDTFGIIIITVIAICYGISFLFRFLSFGLRCVNKLSQTLELVFNNHVGNISIGNPVLI